MSASDHLHPYQMRLFMQAHELMDLPSIDTPWFESMNEDRDLYKEKLKESKKLSPLGEGFYAEKGGETLASSIRKHGVQTPILLGSNNPPTILDGHHRISVKYAQNPDSWIPVEYE